MKTARYLVALTLLFAGMARAQDAIPAGSGGAYNKWPIVTTTGQLGKYITFALDGGGSPSSHSLFLTVAGTAPSPCTFQVEASRDGNPPWLPISGNSTTSPVLSCTASGTFIFANRPFAFIRINILSFTAPDGTTQVKFSYVRGVQ